MLGYLSEMYHTLASSTRAADNDDTDDDGGSVHLWKQRITSINHPTV
jgi:hypothetical protein